MRTWSARRCLGIRLGVFHQYAPHVLARRALAQGDCDPRTLPSISLVTPSYNQARYVGQAIESVLIQNYPKLRYTVQDACSSDGTAAVLAGHAAPGLTTVIEADGGQADGINRGFARQDGDVMGWLNADDVLLPGSLEAVGTFFGSHPDVDVVYGDRIIMDSEGLEIGSWILPGHDAAVLRLIDYVPQETLFWRRRIWDAVGARLDVRYNFALDWELLLRFLRAGARFAHLATPLGGFRVHEGQKTSELIGMTGFLEMRALRRQSVRGLADRCYLTARHALFLARHRICDFRFHRRNTFDS